MSDENELLFDELYEKTKDCGRIQFIKLLMQKEREIQELKEKVKKLSKWDKNKDSRNSRQRIANKNLLKKINELKKQLEEKNKHQIFIDTQDMEERYGEELYKEYLEKDNKQLKQENEKLHHYKKLYQSLKRQKEELRSWLVEQEERAWDEVSSTFGYVLDKLEELEGVSNE